MSEYAYRSYRWTGDTKDRWFVIAFLTALLVTVCGLVLVVHRIHSGRSSARKPRSDPHYQPVPIMYPFDDTLPESDLRRNDDVTTGHDVPERFEEERLLPQPS